MAEKRKYKLCSYDKAVQIAERNGINIDSFANRGSRFWGQVVTLIMKKNNAWRVCITPRNGHVDRSVNYYHEKFLLPLAPTSEEYALTMEEGEGLSYES